MTCCLGLTGLCSAWTIKGLNKRRKKIKNPLDRVGLISYIS